MPPNLFAAVRARQPEEQVDVLIETDAFRLERIVSIAHATPPGEWFDQDRDEWVVLLSGGASLRFEDETGVRELSPGDVVEIPAHRRHRVERTDATAPTVWLALHYRSGGPEMAPKPPDARRAPA
jgi:cupin 2 domain-containing protein